MSYVSLDVDSVFVYDSMHGVYLCVYACLWYIDSHTQLHTELCMCLGLKVSCERRQSIGPSRKSSIARVQPSVGTLTTF